MGRRTGEAADVARELDDGELEAEADTEEGDVLLARPFDCEHHALCTAHSETTGDEYTATGGSVVKIESASTHRINVPR